MWNSTEPPIDPPEEMLATEDLRGNDVYVGDDVFYGDEGIYLVEALTYGETKILNELGWKKGEYQNA